MFLPEPTPTPEAQRLLAADRETNGFLTNTARTWAWQPALATGLFDLMGAAYRAAGLTPRERAVLVVATAAGLRDSYCALAWGRRLVDAADAATAVAVVEGRADGLDPRERELAAWARRMATDPNATRPGDVDRLRAAGFDDAQIAALTAFVALRIAFATVNDALGATPDPELLDLVPPELAAAVRFGRPVRS